MLCLFFFRSRWLGLFILGPHICYQIDVKNINKNKKRKFLELIQEFSVFFFTSLLYYLSIVDYCARDSKLSSMERSFSKSCLAERDRDKVLNIGFSAGVNKMIVKRVKFPKYVKIK